MANFVLVHGAWHGGWCWSRIADILEMAGHKVFAPTLKGLGKRVNEASSSVDLTTHVKDVVALLKSKNLSEVFLVGHSYGGMVITAVADCVPERLARLIYLGICSGRRAVSLRSGHTGNACSFSTTCKGKWTGLAYSSATGD